MPNLNAEELQRVVASVDARSVAGQQCLKEIADHCKGIGTAVERYRRAILVEMGAQSRTAAANGTAPSRTNV